ncbi:MAG: ankyrin repeat domain-containing protein [Elusimicrobia bacterium]|nr:ankyrin repeat domain-containing protein [Elusimicrobiota bacterium]
MKDFRLTAKVWMTLGAGFCALLFSGCTTLSHDVRVGDEVTIKQKLDSGENVNSPDENFGTVGDPATIAMSPSAVVQNNGNVPLHWAALNGYADIAQMLIKHGANVNVQNGGGDTPLDWAALGGHADVAKLLIGAGADINAADGTGDTPLHFAADVGSLDTVNALLASGANPGARDSYGFLPSDYACAEWDLAAPCPKERILNTLQNGPVRPASASGTDSAAPSAAPPAAPVNPAQPQKQWWQQ